jgi:hypothetical protein
MPASVAWLLAVEQTSNPASDSVRASCHGVWNSGAPEAVRRSRPP